MSEQIVISRLRMGELVVTRRAMETLTSNDIVRSLTRHLSGDWGELDEHDWIVNEDAMEFGGRVMSRYSSENGTVFWIATECDRSATTIFLPEEY
jgi:hypothetical protein